MTDDYTPTTERVRSEYARDTNATVKHDVPRAEFDRWLEQMKAEARDEGKRAGRRHLVITSAADIKPRRQPVPKEGQDA